MRKLVGWSLLVLILGGQAFAKTKHSTQKAAQKSADCVTCSMKVIPNLAQQLAKWKPVEMPFHSEGLSPREVKVVQKLVIATRYLDDIYWRQS